MGRLLASCLFYFFLTLTSLAIQGGIPANPNNGNNGKGNNGNGNGNGGQGGQPNNPGIPNVPNPGGPVAGQTAAAAIIATSIGKANANAAAVAATNAAISSAITQTALTLRGLILAPLTSWDIWVTSTGSFDKLNIATISAGFDYRIMPKWVLGATSNWTMGRHIKGSAMNFGPYTALSQWNFYALASEIFNREPETYITFGQVGYIAEFGHLLIGPFYAAQYNSKANSVLNQAGLWLNYPMGRLSPEIQVMWQNNWEELVKYKRDSVWAGLTLNYQVNHSWFISAGYNFEGNAKFQTNQVTLGLKCQL